MNIFLEKNKFNRNTVIKSKINLTKFCVAAGLILSVFTGLLYLVLPVNRVEIALLPFQNPQQASPVGKDRSDKIN